MYCFDNDIYCLCEVCNSENHIDTSNIILTETANILSRNCINFSCFNCGSMMMYMYSLVSEDPQNGFVMQSSIQSTYNMNILEKVNIVEDPIFISKLKNVTPEEYQRTLQLIQDLNSCFTNIYNVNRREFEFIVAELVRRKGFKVEVTKKTRDGGKDIIAIKNISGIPIKIIVECKHPDFGNPVGVDVVRSLYGVHNSKNGPNKSLLVTSSYLTKDAKNFVANETNSQWEIGLYDLQDLQNWIAH